MTELVRLLHTGNHTCVIAHGTEIRTFDRRGVADLYDLLQHNPSFLKGAVVADKVVGKAAAALMVIGGIRQLHADVLSQHAAILLQETDIKVEAEQTVPYIQNRDQSGRCPLESISIPLHTVDEIYEAISRFLENK